MSRTTRPIRSTPATIRRRGLLAAGVAALAAAVALPALPSVAATDAAQPAAANGGPGWVRLAHLSPDTKAVDVRVSSLSGDTTLFTLSGVAYGAVSPYRQLPGGTYTVTMVPSGKSMASKPLLSAAVKVQTGKASTVAAFGSNRRLKLTTFNDDLTQPAAGTARVRLIQASTKVSSVDVSTVQGTAIANKALAGTATGYAAVPAGSWTLALTSSKLKNTSQVDLAPGSVSTLLVLDDTKGLTVRPVLDSAATAAAPVGGVNTGGGYLASKGLTGPIRAVELEGR